MSILGSGLGLLVAFMRSASIDSGSSIVLTLIARLFPSYGVASAMATFVITANKNVQCNLFPEEHREMICKLSDGGYSFMEDVKKCCGTNHILRNTSK